jgi:hypothetical protein
MAVIGWRDSPHASTTVGSLFKPVAIVFFDTIRWIGHHGMNTGLRSAGKPIQTIGMNEQRLPDGNALKALCKSLEARLHDGVN